MRLSSPTREAILVAGYAYVITYSVHTRDFPQGLRAKQARLLQTKSLTLDSVVLANHRASVFKDVCRLSTFRFGEGFMVYFITIVLIVLVVILKRINLSNAIAKAIGKIYLMTSLNPDSSQSN